MIARRNGLCSGGAAWRLLLILMLAAPSHSGQEGALAGGATISVNVDLVLLRATVRDRKGKFVPDLRREDFHVFEDGKPQTITLFRHGDIPVSAGLVVDNSSSMAAKRRDVTAAAVAFARSSNPRDELFVVNFNGRASFGLPPAKPFTSSPLDLEEALNGVPANGMTALYDGIEEGLSRLKTASLDRKALIVVSDGGDNASRHTLAQALRDAERSNVVIYTIGIFDETDGDQNPRVLKRLARVSGGEAFFPASLSEVTPVCEDIAADIRQQYTLGYTPSNRKFDGAFRRIQVTAGRPGGGKLFVRTREGYIAPWIEKMRKVRLEIDNRVKLLASPEKRRRMVRAGAIFLRGGGRSRTGILPGGISGSQVLSGAAAARLHARTAPEDGCAVPGARQCVAAGRSEGWRVAWPSRHPAAAARRDGGGGRG